MASSSPPSRVFSLTLPALPSGIRLPAREKGLGRPLPPSAHERGAELPQQGGVVGGCYKEVWIDSEKREIREQKWGGGRKGKGAELTQAWALRAAVAVGCGPKTRNGSPCGSAGVGLPRRRLLPPVPPPPELRLPRKLIAT